MLKDKFFISILIFLLISISIASLYKYNTNSNKDEAFKVKIADLPIVQGLPLYLALEKGYFEEVGIKVERVKFQNPNQIIDALISGQVQFAADAATGITGIADTKNPEKLKIFLLTGGDDVIHNDSILVRNDSSLSSIQELKGKKLGILPGIQWRTIAQHILKQHNLIADKDIILIELAPGLQAQALQSNQIDALLGVEPIPTIVKSNNIGKEIVSFATIQDVSNPFYGGAGVVNAEFAKQNPDTTKKVIEVFDRAVQEINQNPDIARQYLKEYTPLTDDLASKVPIAIFKMYNDFDENDIKVTQDFYNIFTENEVVNVKINSENLIYSD